ncbi:MAG: hypothetical protein KDA28_09650, partial [Phycisphaerales bacterium]|nr:hypothetical protein [Phycisphaerales bacterium]
VSMLALADPLGTWDVIPDRLVWRSSERITCEVRGVLLENGEPIWRQFGQGVDLDPMGSDVDVTVGRRTAIAESNMTQDGDVVVMTFMLDPPGYRWEIEPGLFVIQPRFGGRAATPKIRVEKRLGRVDPQVIPDRLVWSPGDGVIGTVRHRGASTRIHLRESPTNIDPSWGRSWSDRTTPTPGFVEDRLRFEPVRRPWLPRAGRMVLIGAESSDVSEWVEASPPLFAPPIDPPVVVRILESGGALLVQRSDGLIREMTPTGGVRAETRLEPLSRTTRWGRAPDGRLYWWDREATDRARDITLYDVEKGGVLHLSRAIEGWSEGLALIHADNRWYGVHADPELGRALDRFPGRFDVTCTDGREIRWTDLETGESSVFTFPSRVYSNILEGPSGMFESTKVECGDIVYVGSDPLLQLWDGRCRIFSHQGRAIAGNAHAVLVGGWYGDRHVMTHDGKDVRVSSVPTRMSPMGSQVALVGDAIIVAPVMQAGGIEFISRTAQVIDARTGAVLRTIDLLGGTP